VSSEVEMYEDGGAAFLGQEDAWHRLGVTIGRPFTWIDVQENCATVAMAVRKIALADLMPFHSVPADMFANVREDEKILSVVGDKYEVVQSVEMYEFGCALQGFADLPLVSVVGLREGRQYAFTYHLGDSTVGGEQIRHYVSVVGSHDGSIANLVIRSSIVIVCANTMAAAITSGVDRITLRHTVNVRERMDAALEVIGVATDGVARFEAQVAKLQVVKLETREFDLILDGLFPITDAAARTANEVLRARTAIRDAFYSPLTEGFKGTGWAAVQAVNSYEQWAAPVRKTKGVATDTVRALRQFDSMVKGGQPLTQKATALVLA
jgi:phage/plasmid-like protein (TIGR03299 family)